MQTVNWERAAMCALRNKKKSLPEIAAAMAAEQPDIPSPEHVKVHKGWGGIMSNGLDTLEVDTGWGGFGTGNRTPMLAIFKTRKQAGEMYQHIAPVTITVSE